LKRGWHEGEERAIRKGVLVERYEKGWVEQDQVVVSDQLQAAAVPVRRDLER